MANLPGVNLSDTPPLPGSQPQPPATPLPAFWFDPQEIIARVLALVPIDPQTAAEIWREYKRLRAS